MNIFKVAFDMSKQQATCSIRHSTCRMLQVACCFDMLPVATFDMSKQHVERCFDMLPVAVRHVASTCCWCGRGLSDILSCAVSKLSRIIV